MNRSTILAALAIGFSALGLSWATARHFTGLAQEFGVALAIAIGVGLAVAVGYAALESRRFGLRRRNRHR